MTTTAPRRAVLAAWAVPLCVLPSAVWRITAACHEKHDGWYLLLLSGLSMTLALLTLGLVQPWGEHVPPRLVGALATTGAVLLLAITGYFFANQAFHLVDHAPAWIGRNDVVHEKPGWHVLRWYLPLVLWGPLLLAVTRDFRRRHPGPHATRQPTR